MARRGSVGGKVHKGGEETTWTRARGKCGAGKRYGKARMCSPKKAFSVTWGPLATATKCPSGWKASEMMEKSKRMTFTQQLRAMLHTRT